MFSCDERDTQVDKEEPSPEIRKAETSRPRRVRSPRERTERV